MLNEQISESGHRLMNQIANLDLQLGALFDQIDSVPTERLQRLVDWIDGQQRKTVSIDRGMKDSLEIVLIGLKIGV